MDAQAKKTALRMIPYGLYVLTGETRDGRVAASTVNWATQASFEPPLIAIGVKASSATHGIIKDAGCFALNFLGKGQESVASAFFKPSARSGDKICGQTFRQGTTGSPILADAPAYVECTLIETVERGDHSVFVGEVVDAGLHTSVDGRPDEVTLCLKDLGDDIFYGG